MDYYNPFLTTLHAVRPQSLEIVGIGQEGHSPDQPLSYLEALHQPDFLHQRLLPTLDDQITRKISHVDYLREQYGSELRLVLIGHSVGVYICQEVGGASFSLSSSIHQSLAFRS